MKGRTFVPIALLVWALVASLSGAYFYYLYNDLSQKTRKTVMHVNLGFNYGNGTVHWFNNTEAIEGDTLLDVTLRVAEVSYITSSSGAYINSINKVRNNATRGWTWWAEQFGWGYNVASDKYVLLNHETAYWYYIVTGGETAGQEKVSIISVQYSAGTITVNAKSTGGGAIIITDVVIKDASGNTLAVKDITNVTLPSDGSVTTVTITYTLIAGNYYTVTLVSMVGNTFVSPSFKA